MARANRALHSCCGTLGWGCAGQIIKIDAGEPTISFQGAVFDHGVQTPKQLGEPKVIRVAPTVMVGSPSYIYLIGCALLKAS